MALLPLGLGPAHCNAALQREARQFATTPFPSCCLPHCCSYRWPTFVSQTFILQNRDFCIKSIWCTKIFPLNLNFHLVSILGKYFEISDVVFSPFCHLPSVSRSVFWTQYMFAEVEGFSGGVIVSFLFPLILLSFQLFEALPILSV